MKTIACFLAALLCCVAHAARNFTAGSSQYINIATAPVSEAPFTISFWLKRANTNTAYSLVALNSATSSRAQITTAINGAVSVQSYTTGGVANSALSPDGTAIAGTWIHIVGVYSSTSSRVCWINGVSQATNTTDVPLVGIDRVLLGARINSGSIGAYLSGDLAEVGIWNVALSSSDIAALAGGAKPLRVRPTALRAYVPLTGTASTEVNYIGVAGTLTNAPVVSAHPRVY